MENVTMRTEGQKLIVEIDLTKRLRPSASGKTLIVASTHGNVAAPGHPEVRLGINAYVGRP